MIRKIKVRHGTRVGMFMIALSLIFFCGFVAAEEPPSSGEERLNLVLISLDTVRPDHLSAYGYHRKTSPEIDRIAREGTLFTQAFSQSGWTMLSQGSLFSSRYPRADWFRKDMIGPDPSVGTLTEVLKQNGYRTAACTSFGDTLGSSQEKMLASSAFQAFDFMLFEHRLYAPPRVLFKWLFEHRDEPFFLFLHGYDAHGPVLPIEWGGTVFGSEYHGDLPSTYVELFSEAALSPEQWHQIPKLDRYKLGYKISRERMFVSGKVPPENLAQMLAIYDTQIYHMDEGLGRIFTALENLGIAGRTLIVIVSDHGQAFGEHGEYATHGSILYDEVTRMVLIVRDPRPRPRQSRIDTLVEGIDVMPTVLELLDIPVPKTAEGRSLVRLMETGQDPTLQEHALSFTRHPLRRSIRTREWKMLEGDNGWDELYHLARDPEEQKNVMERYPSVVSELRERFETIYTLEQEEALSQDDKAWIQEHGYW